MNYTNYSIKESKGVFYTTSKTPADGYTENRYEDRTTKETKVNYHKEVDKLEGTVKSFGRKETPFGERFYISLAVDEDNTSVLEIPVFDGRESMNSYLKSFCMYLGNLEKGQQLTISLNKTAKNAKGYLYKTVYLSSEGEGLSWVFHPQNDVPKATKSISKITKKETWDFTAVEEFYFEQLEKVVSTPTTTTDNTTSREVAQQKTAPVETENPFLASEEADDDDLPF